MQLCCSSSIETSDKKCTRNSYQWNDDHLQSFFTSLNGLFLSPAAAAAAAWINNIYTTEFIASIVNLAGVNKEFKKLTANDLWLSNSAAADVDLGESYKFLILSAHSVWCGHDGYLGDDNMIFRFTWLVQK